MQDVTLMRYIEHVSWFKKFCLRRKLVLSDIHKVDKHMATYFADLVQHDAAYNTASYTLFGYLMLEADEPMADKFLLPHSRAALKGWASRYPQSSRTGADPDLWFLIAKHLCDIDTRLAAVLLIQLDTYARPSEILGLRKHDVVKPVGRNKLWGIIFGNSVHHEQTKTGTQDDTVFLDSLHDFAPAVAKLVYNSCRQHSGFLFPGCTLGHYESSMRQVVKHLGLAKFALTPHAVRHSGPSQDFLNKSRTADEIQARGRWKSLRSIQRYRKPGQMVAKMNRIPEHIWVEARQSLKTVLRALKQFYGGR